MAHTIELNQQNFEEEVLLSEIPVLVDFWAVWCGPCLAIAPVVERIAEQYEGRLKVGKLDVDQNQDLAIKYQVMSIPTLIFFKNGDPVDRAIGRVPEAQLIEKVEQILGQAGNAPTETQRHGDR